jgi:SAM-dependent methyltransferase
MKGIRNAYEAYGAEEYYRQFGESYENPHQAQISALLQRNAHRWDLNKGVLDFCAGGGEATLAIAPMAKGPVTGCDPFTHNLYEQQTGNTCLRLSFDDVLKGATLGDFGVVICSFALHLCPQKDLFSVTWALLNAAPTLVIITPHKRPELERLPGIALLYEDQEPTERGKMVRLKEYGLGS